MTDNTPPGVELHAVHAWVLGGPWRAGHVHTRFAYLREVFLKRSRSADKLPLSQ